MKESIVTGNYYDKYNSKNPLVRQIMAGFHAAFDELIGLVPNLQRVFEIGCGEGNLSLRIAQRGCAIAGCDIAADCTTQAAKLLVQNGHQAHFFARNFYDLAAADVQNPDLIVCCEVLEHTLDPERALNVLATLAKNYVLLSVPREPIWRILNVMRGRYLSDLGNTPGHLQHWSSRQFIDFVEREFEVLQSKYPLPWTMLLCKAK